VQNKNKCVDIPHTKHGPHTRSRKCFDNNASPYSTGWQPFTQNGFGAHIHPKDPLTCVPEHLGKTYRRETSICPKQFGKYYMCQPA